VISIVCFDLGGVLVRLSKSWLDAAERAGVLQPDSAETAKAAAVIDDETVRAERWQIVQAYQAGFLSCEQYYKGLSDVMRGYSPSDVRKIHAAWILGHYPGADALIEQLEQLPNLRTACLSNTNHAHWQQLTQPGGEYPGVLRLHTRLASHELGLNKPDPRIYERAAELLGQPPEQILFFDDLPDNVAAAREAGWHCEQIDPEADPPAQMRVHLLRHGIHLQAQH
jgi:glucose-1-phosphatase